MGGFTPGPWKSNCFLVVATSRPGGLHGGQEICHTGGGRTNGDEAEANAALIAAAPTQHEEMVRYLPILERAEADPEIWNKLTAGTGIATANGYRHAINQALGKKDGQ